MRWITATICLVLLATIVACSADPPALQQQAQAVSQDAERPQDQESADTIAQQDTAEPAAAANSASAAPSPVERTTLSPRWPRDSWRPLAEVARDNADLQLRIEREAEWCAESLRLYQQNGARWGTPTASGRWEELDGPTLIDQSTHPWIGAVIHATAEARGLPLDATPAIQMMSLDWMRASQCEYWYPRHGEFDPARSRAWHLWHVGLGLLESAWTPELLDVLSAADQSSWHVYHPGMQGSITLVASASTANLAQALSHQVASYLQRGLLDGRELRRLPWRVEMDRWMSLWWLREADASHATLQPDHTAIQGAIDQLEPETSDDDHGLPRYSDLASEVSDWLVSPERDSAEFVAQLLLEGGPDALNDRLRDPPDTMEQLLHVDKYESRESALDMTVLDTLIERALPREAWRVIGQEPSLVTPYQDTLGEYYLRLLISASTGRQAEASAAAAGWGGDRLYAFQRDGGGQDEWLTLWALAFDDAGEHTEGIAGLREWLVAFSNGQAWGAADKRVIGWDTPHGAIRVVDHLRTAWVLVAGDAATADDLAAALLQIEADVEWW